MYRSELLTSYLPATGTLPTKEEKALVNALSLHFDSAETSENFPVAYFFHQVERSRLTLHNPIKMKTNEGTLPDVNVRSTSYFAHR